LFLNVKARDEGPLCLRERRREDDENYHKQKYGSYVYHINFHQIFFPLASGSRLEAFKEVEVGGSVPLRSAALEAEGKKT